MKIYPNADNINQHNCDFQLVHVGDDDESIHGATNFKKNTVNDSDQMSYESDTSKENSNHEDQHSYRSPEYQEQQDSIGSPEDHEEQQQENLNDDDEEEEEKEREEEEASVYATHAVFENDRHSVFEDDDEIVDGAYLSNELTTLVNSWYNKLRRIPFNLRIVYILLLLVFTQLSFVEYRLYMLSRQTEIHHHQSSESFSDDLEVCCPSVPLVPAVPTVTSVPTVPNSRNGKNKNHGQHTRHQRSNGRHKKVHHRR